MSCDCEFPQPSLRCVLELVRKARQGGKPNELLKSALCLAGGLVDRLPSACDEGEDIGDDVLELLEQLSQVAEAHEADFVSADADEQIWEIIIPILLPIAIDLLKSWLDRRRGGL